MAMLDDAAADLQQTVAALQRELGQRTVELDEAVAREAALAEVLRVIKSSPGDLAPVFDAMVERAVRLCEADEAAVRTSDGELLHLVAACGEPQVFERLRQLGPSRLDRPGGLYDQIARGERVTHSPMFGRPTPSATIRRRENGWSCGIFEPGSPSRCARRRRSLASSTSIGTRSGHFPTSKSRCCKISPTRRSSRSKTRG